MDTIPERLVYTISGSTRHRGQGHAQQGDQPSKEQRSEGVVNGHVMQDGREQGEEYLRVRRGRLHKGPGMMAPKNDVVVTVTPARRPRAPGEDGKNGQGR